MCSRTPSGSARTAWLGKPTRGREQRAIGHGVAVRERFSAFDSCADFETTKHDHYGRRPEPGVAPSRSRHRPPSPWIIECSPISPASAAWQNR